MNSDEEWDLVQGTETDSYEPAKSGALRISMLFGSIAVAFALFLVPILNRGTDSLVRAPAAQVDSMTTASASRSKEYTIRKSVLQSKNSIGCKIRNDGSSVGEC